MKKIILLSLAAAALALPAAAIAQTAVPAPATAAPSAGADKKVQLKDSSWAQVAADGSVTVSKDGGKTWTAAPDGTWEAMDGSKLMTKGGKAQ